VEAEYTPMSSQADAPLVSIFVQAYNTAAYVGECLASVLTQESRHAIEVLVIDDASTDGTTDVIAKFSDPRLRLIRHERNTGAIATANEGYGLARGEFIARLDSDDRIRPQFVDRMVSALAENPRLGFAYGDVVTIDDVGRVTSTGGVVRRSGPAVGNELFALLLDNYIPAPATMVRREALQPLLPIPSHYRFLDWYLTTGIAERWDSCFMPEVLADYRVHGANMHRAMILDRRGEATSQEVLDRLFQSSIRQDEKRRWRSRVYARHFLTYAEKYFGCGMNADARRCYRRAIQLEPGLLLQSGVARHFGATVIGRPLYESAKARLKALRAS
jgi:glycosyltransferase involved in cell wall biosynthesis